MDFRTDLPTFRSAFLTAARAVPTTGRAAKPALCSVRLSIDESGRATLEATNLELWIRVSVPGVMADQAGVVLLPHDKLSGILKTANPNELLECSVRESDSKIHVRSGRAKWEVPTEDPDSFPSVPGFSAAQWCVVTAEGMRKLIGRTAFAADPNTTRFALGGCLVEQREEEIEKGILAFVTTDGRTLCRQTVPTIPRLGMPNGHPDSPNGPPTGRLDWGGELPGKNGPVVPLETLAAVAGMLPKGDEEVVIGFPDKNRVQFRFGLPGGGEASITSPLCEGRFPIYYRAIPERGSRSARVMVKDLLGAVGQATAMPCRETHRLRLSFGVDVENEPNSPDRPNGVCGIEVVGGESGMARSEVEVNWSGGAATLDVSAPKVMDLLRALPGEAEVVVTVADEGGLVDSLRFEVGGEEGEREGDGSGDGYRDMFEGLISPMGEAQA